jgi:hypothetical protein
MESLVFFGVRLIVGGGEPPSHDNDNWGVCSWWQTPAEALQGIRRMKDEMRRELAADARLWNCPRHRRIWESVLAAEKCALWQHFGVRDR